MTTSYSIPAGTNKVELEIKRSKFIAYAINVSDRQQAEAFVTHLKSTNRKAAQIGCSYIAGSPGSAYTPMCDVGESIGPLGVLTFKVI